MKTYALQIANRNRYVLAIEEITGESFEPSFVPNDHFERLDTEVNDEMFAELMPIIGTIQAPKFVESLNSPIPPNRIAVTVSEGELVVVSA